MTRPAGLRVALMGASLLALTVAVADCSRKEPPVAPGSVNLALTLSSAAKIETVHYLISGNGIAPIMEVIDVSKVNTATKLVSGLPAGKGYTVELDATAVGGAITCTASAKIDVVEGKTTEAKIIMQCSDSRGSGGVSITGSFDNCPSVTSYTAAPTSALLNKDIALQSSGVDLDGDPLTFKWIDSAGLGDFGLVVMTNNRTASCTFKCKTPGMTTLTVSASDGTCDDRASISVTCLDDGSGSGSGGTTSSGTGGSVGGGQTGGTPGSSGTGGTGGVTSPGTGGGSSSGGSSANGGGGPAGAGGKGGMAGMLSSIGGTGFGGNGSCYPSHCSGAKCEACSFADVGAPECADALVDEPCGLNCPSGPSDLNGCDALTDPTDRRLCEALYACFLTHLSECVADGNPLKCWCGSNPLTCPSDNSGATMANGVCLSAVVAAAKLPGGVYDAPTIKNRFTDAAFPSGRAVNLLQCRASWCSMSCSLSVGGTAASIQSGGP